MLIAMLIMLAIGYLVIAKMDTIGMVPAVLYLGMFVIIMCATA